MNSQQPDHSYTIPILKGRKEGETILQPPFPTLHTPRHLLQTLDAKRVRDLRLPGRLLRLLHRLLRVPGLRDAFDEDAAELEQFFLFGRGALLAREVEQFHG